MISCDTTILWAALDADNAAHPQALRFLREQADNEAFAVCELVLVEFYVLLRNPALAEPPLGSAEAATVVQRYRRHPRWRVIDLPGGDSGIMDEVWKLAAKTGFPRRRIFDARLALTLRHHGVTEFATANAKDFAGFGFRRVWNPLA